MRELVKSLNSFSWAMSLFSAQQLVNLVQRPASGADHLSAAELGAATQAGQQQLSGVFLRAFEAGDQVQRSAVDLAFGVATLEALNPNRFVALSSEVVRQSTAAFRSLLPGGKTEGSGGQPCGWGPMPPAR